MIDCMLFDDRWTLFLDRDGVINHEKDGDYIRNAGEFHFYDGVPEAMAVLQKDSEGSSSLPTRKALAVD